MRTDLRLLSRMICGVGALLAALVLVLGVAVVPDPADTTPSAVRKLYDPKDL